MSKSVAAPQTQVAPSVSTDLAPQQGRDIPWGLGVTALMNPGSAVLVGGLMGMGWLREQMKGGAAPALTPRQRYEQATTPEDKLAAWKEMHKDEAAQRFGAHEQTSWFDWSAEDDAREHRNDVKDQTLAATRAEVEDEADALLTQHAKDGTSLTMEEVEALDARKEYELDIESSRGVNLTSTPGATAEERAEDPEAAAVKDAERRVWSMEELAQVDDALGRMPTDAVRDNSELTAIHRSAYPTSRDGDAGSYEDGVLGVHDNAKRVRVDPETGWTDNGASSGVADTVAQNMALAVAAQHPEVYEAFEESMSANGGDVKNTLPTVADAYGMDSWANAKVSTESAFKSLYARRTFDAEQTQQTLMTAPQEQLWSDERHLQARKDDRLAARQQGADLTELDAQNKDIELQSTEIQTRQAAQQRRQGLWDAVNSLF